MMPQPTHPGLLKIIQAVEEDHSMPVDHGYVVRLVQEVKRLRGDPPSMSLREASEKVIQNMETEPGKFMRHLYEQILREYCT